MPQTELNVGDYFRIFRKRKFTIFLTFLFVVSLAFFYSGSQVPVYVSEAKVKVVERRSVIGGRVIQLVSVGDFIATQEEVIKGRAVAEKVAADLGLINPAMGPAEIEGVIRGIQGSISTSRVQLTNIIRIIATAADSKLAQEVAETAAKAYVQLDLEEKSQEVTGTRQFIEKELEKAEKNLEESQKELASFQAQGGVQRGQLDFIRNEVARLEVEREGLLLKATSRHPQVEILEEQIARLRQQLEGLPSQEALKLENLRREVDDSAALVSNLKTHYHEAKIGESEKVSDVIIVDHARPGRVTAASNRMTNTVIGGVMGFLLGFVLAFLKEGLDTSIGAIEDVESFLGVQVVGIMPHMSIGKEEAKRGFFSSWRVDPGDKVKTIRSQLVTQFDPRSPEAEAYHTLRTNIYSILGEKNHLIVLLTSSGPREGKSITSANFAVASAQMGKKTLLVDADLRRPMVHQIFGLDRGPGLFEAITGAVPYDRALKNIADILIGNMEWEKTLQTPHMAYLNLMTAGHLPSNPPELLNSQEMDEMLKRFRDDFDLVILDSPPILPVTDALILGPKCDGVLLVYQAGRTARGALKRSKIQLDTAKAKVLGVVLNDVRATEMEPGSSYYYRYRKYYSDEIKKEESDKAEDREANQNLAGP